MAVQERPEEIFKTRGSHILIRGRIDLIDPADEFFVGWRSTKGVPVKFADELGRRSALVNQCVKPTLGVT
jgi:hypothetical protein